MQKRLQSLLMAIIIMLTILPQLAMPAQAAYENTYKNTGDQRADIIGVALTQVGYLEGDGIKNNNKNKYGAYFGKDGMAWCGFFVSWCARQADIPKSVLKSSGPANPSTFGITTVHKSGYTPKPGDLYFKKDYSHVGIVYKISGNYFYSIEGNTWTGGARKDGLYIKKKLISDFYYGVPKYTGDAATANCSHSYQTKSESSHPHKEYKICSKCSKKTYTGNYKTLKDCKSCIQDACTHKFGAWENSSSTKHRRVCTLCDKSETGSHKWSAAEIVKEATCSQKGSSKQTCSTCNAEKTSTIAATGKHVFEDLVYIDDKYHGNICTQCEKEDKSKHKSDGEWTSDGKNHWNFCTECGERYNVATHTYQSGCGSNCTVCNYTSPFSHELSENYTADKEKHYKTCDLCGQAVEPGEHTYTSDCDESCNICDGLRSRKTAHKYETYSDQNSHWQCCTVCAQESEHIPHSPDLNAKDWENQNCTECGFTIHSAEQHIHTYQSIDYDRRTHWGTCACGEEIPAEGHRFSMETGQCGICNATSSPIGAQYDYDWVWLAAAGAFSTIVLTMVLVLLIRRIVKRRH